MKIKSDEIEVVKEGEGTWVLQRMVETGLTWRMAHWKVMPRRGIVLDSVLIGQKVGFLPHSLYGNQKAECTGTELNENIP